MSRALKFLACCVVLLALPCAAAHAATGEIAYQGCVEDPAPPSAGCTADNQGLLGAFGVVVSPDGKSVYVAGLNEDMVSILSRDPGTGALTPAGCIADDEVFGTSGCADFAQALDGPFGIAVSPSGLDVYVASFNDQAVSHLTRDANTGELSDGGCVPYTGDDAGCGTAPQAGLDFPRDLVVSPDGGSVYVAGGFGSGEVVRLARNTNTGNISATGDCIGTAGTPPGCLTLQQPGLYEAYDIDISPGGNSVHVASRGSGAVVSLGVPGFASLGCYADSDTPVAGCTPLQGLQGARGIAVSPDGESVYSNSNDGAVVRFDRAVNGSLTPAGCIQDSDVELGCGQETQGLQGGQGIVVSPDDASVYSVSDEDTLVRFDRDSASGALTPQGCFIDVGLTGCAGSAPAINNTRAVEVSPDGKSVYLASTGDNAVNHFTRVSGSVVPPPVTGEVRVDSDKVKCKGSCKKIKVKVKVDKPGEVKFCNAPPDVNAPCGINGPGPTGPERATLAKKAPKLIVDKVVEVAAAGTVTTQLKLTKKAQKTIAKKGKLSIKLQVDFTPDGGELGSDRQTLKVKGKKKKG